MSQAGARSWRGDEYQLRIALPWLLRLWTDPRVISVQVESLGLAGDADVPLVDDIVVEEVDGSRIYIQAKKNHPEFGTWSLRDRELRAELTKARDQLERDGIEPRSVVRFYSRSPFGSLNRLAEGAGDYPDFGTFSANAPATLTDELKAIAQLWQRSSDQAFALVCRIDFTVTSDYDEMDRDALAALRTVFARPEEVRDFLEERLRSQHARVRDPVVVFRRGDLENLLAERGHVPSPARDEADQLAAFRLSSEIGRSWVRDVAGVRVQRSETRAILDGVATGARTVLLLGEPGIGKTCVLLDLADALEQDSARVLLFIKGDRFSGAQTDAELAERGLPDDIVGRCARFAVHRPVVVVVDALDVLSLQRQGGTLELFLGLMDRLAVVKGVTVVAACRTFDVEFDPLLRGRTWDRRVTVAPLDVQRDVAPILEGWGVRPGELDPELIELLRVPGRLWLYGQVLGDGPIQRVGSLYELHDRYLEAVGREPGWGPGALDVLDRVTVRMQEARTLEVSRVEMRAPAAVVQGLLSRGVLVATERGYAFGHQELLDVVAVRAAQRRGQRLHDFVTGHPALPFLRPTVRVFLHVLRADDPVVFRRDIRAFLSAQEIAYHLRRLVAETLAEITADEEDLSLLRWLMRSHGDLFERFVQRATAVRWLEPFVHALLPTARRVDEAERWTGRVLRHLAGWVALHPEIVLPTWREALEEGWPGADALGWSRASVLEASIRAAGDRFPWADAEWLVRHLVEGVSEINGDSYVVGPVVQAWVEARGDDTVLMNFLNLEGSGGEAAGGLNRRVRGLRRRADASALPTEFIASRMAASDSFVDAVLAFVLREAANAVDSFRRGILHETSWRGRHNRGMMHHDVFNDILRALENALGDRAARDDVWWRQHRRALVRHEDTGVRYLAVQALRHAPERNVEVISSLLTDPTTLQFGELDSEIDELAHEAYPFLSPEVAAEHQATVLACSERRATDTEEWRAELRLRRAYERLLWVPRPYRSPEAGAFIRRWEGEFGPYRSTPRIYMSGGFVGPPVSAAQIEDLSDLGVLRVIDYWGMNVFERDFGEALVGGWDQLVGSVRDAAMNVPVRALGWLDSLIESDAPAPYRDACVGGVALHLQVRFAKLRPSGTWAPAEPLPDGHALGRKLLDLVERFRESWIGEHTLSQAVEACTHVLHDPESAGRLTVLLVRLAQSPNPNGSSEHDAAFQALNSTRGRTALAAVRLAAAIVSSGDDLPEELLQLLLRFATDARPGVRWALLQGVVPLTQSQPDLAWSLFDEATVDSGTDEWEVAEPSLYYNYHGQFDRVGPVLDRIRATAMQAAGGVYGRIGALSWLAGHLDDAALFGALPGSPPSVWAGMAEVFSANLGDAEHGARSEEGLLRLLTAEDVPDSAGQAVAAALERDTKRKRVSRRVVEALLELRPDPADHDMRVHAAVAWAAEEARHDALGILPVLEKVAGGVDAGQPRRLHGTRDLVVALTAVMREADETDDSELIARVVALQDRLLRLGVDDVDQMLDAASRP
jgi:hypothetical protein